VAVIKVADIAWARLRSPDVDRQEEFLLDFGMVRSDRTNKALYMRGTDASHHLHVTEQGDPAFIGHAYHAESEEDLHKIARVEGASPIEEIDEPAVESACDSKTRMGFKWRSFGAWRKRIRCRSVRTSPIAARIVIDASANSIALPACPHRSSAWATAC